MKTTVASIILLVLIIPYSACRKSKTFIPGNDTIDVISIKDSLLVLDSLVYTLRVNQRQKAVSYAKTSLMLAECSRDSSDIIKALNTLGNAYNQFKTDSSFYYYSRALLMAEKTNRISDFPQLIYNLSILYYYAFDYKNALLLLDSTIKIAIIRGNSKLLADAYNAIGNINMDIGLDSEAVKSYLKASDISRKENLYRQLGASLANLSQYEENTDVAVRYNRDAILSLSKIPGTDHEIATILGNIGYMMSNPDSALFYYNQAIKVADKYGFSDVLINTYNNMSCCYLEQNDLSRAEYLIKNKAIPLAERDSNYDLLATLYDTYSEIMVKRNDYPKAIKYQKDALDYRTRADTRKTSDQVRLLSALLDTRNKELLIRKQSVEIDLQHSLTRQYRLFLLLAGLIAIGLLFFFIWFRQRTRFKLQQVQLDSARRIIEAGEHEKTKIGRELHDTSTQLTLGMRQVVEEMVFGKESDREQLYHEIDTIRERIRDISHRMHQDIAGKSSFEELLNKLCKELKERTTLNIDHSVASDLDNLSDETVFHCYRIVQELFSNALKYAREAPLCLIFIRPTDFLCATPIMVRV